METEALIALLADALRRARPYVEWCLQSDFTSPSAQSDLYAIDAALQRASQAEYEENLDALSGISPQHR